MAKKHHSGKCGKRFTPLRLAAYFVFVACAVFVIFNFQIFPYAAASSTADAQNEISAVVSAAVNEVLAEYECNYSDLVSITKDDTGRIAAVSANTVLINRIYADITAKTIEKLTVSGGIYVGIPLGNLLGGELAAGRGPLVNIRLSVARGYESSLESSLTEAGINQVLHRIYIKIKVRVTVMIPTEHVSVPVTVICPLTETLISGDVPDAYTKIIRGIDETTIDDIYDFGAAMN